MKTINKDFKISDQEMDEFAKNLENYLNSDDYKLDKLSLELLKSYNHAKKELACGGIVTGRSKAYIDPLLSCVALTVSSETYHKMIRPILEAVTNHDIENQNIPDGVAYAMLGFQNIKSIADICDQEDKREQRK